MAKKVVKSVTKKKYTPKQAFEDYIRLHNKKGLSEADEKRMYLAEMLLIESFTDSYVLSGVVDGVRYVVDIVSIYQNNKDSYRLHYPWVVTEIT